MSFKSDMEWATRKITDAHNKIASTAALDLFASTIRDTPVDLGGARGGWTTKAVVEPAKSPDRLDPTGELALAEMRANVPYGAGQEVFMANTLPYIERLEYGYSKKAPQGMVRRNIARVQRIVDAAIAKFRV